MTFTLEAPYSDYEYETMRKCAAVNRGWRVAAGLGVAFGLSAITAFKPKPVFVSFWGLGGFATYSVLQTMRDAACEQEIYMDPDPRNTGAEKVRRFLKENRSNAAFIQQFERMHGKIPAEPIPLNTRPRSYPEMERIWAARMQLEAPPEDDAVFDLGPDEKKMKNSLGIDEEKSGDNPEDEVYYTPEEDEKMLERRSRFYAGRQQATQSAAQ